jgi:hypothetical protein
VAAAVILLGIVVGLLALAFGARRVTEGLEDLARTEADELRDVEVDQCDTDDDGFMAARLRVTNQSSETSNYIIEVSFDRADGGEQLATAMAMVTGLAPDQFTEVEAISGENASGEFDCRIGFVERLSAEG